MTTEARRRHTPGPWQALKAEWDQQVGFNWWLYSPNYGCVGYWTGGKQDHKDGRWLLSDVDAHLIAAAPDLLCTLKDLLAACEDDCGAVGDLTEYDGDDEPVGGGLNDDGSPDPMALTFGHLRRAARAIAKAEGRA